MPVVVVSPPAPLVGLDLLKQHLRVDGSDDDALITAYAAAAQGQIDGPAGWLGRAIGPQTLELRLDRFDAGDWQLGRGSACAWDRGAWNWTSWPFRRIELPCPPLIDIVSITYEDPAGVDQVLTSDGWRAGDDSVTPSFDAAWPAGRVEADAVRIRYRAGYAADPEADPLVAAPPAPIVAAIMLMTGGLYETREDITVSATRSALILNPAAEALLAPYRVFRQYR